MYARFVSERFKAAFDTVCMDHHIWFPPVFLINGKAVNLALLKAQLPNALVEIVFTLHHYHIGVNKVSNKPGYTKDCSQPKSHTFMAMIKHVKILQSHFSKSSSSSSMHLKVLPHPTSKGKKRNSNDQAAAEPSKKGCIADLCLSHSLFHLLSFVQWLLFSFNGICPPSNINEKGDAVESTLWKTL